MYDVEQLSSTSSNLPLGDGPYQTLNAHPGSAVQPIEADLDPNQFAQLIKLLRSTGI